LKLQLIPVGDVDGRPVMYYRARAEEVFVGLISFPGGAVPPAGETAYPAVHIVYPPDFLPIVLSVIILMASQGRSPQVCFEPVGEYLEVMVLFRALVSREMLTSLPNIRETRVDLFQVAGEHKAELLVTAKTNLPLEDGEKLLTLFGGKFKVIVGITGSMGIGALWEGEVSSYEKKKPDFAPRD